MAVAFFVAWDGRPLSPTGYESVGSIYLWLWILVQTLCLMLPALGLLIVCAALNTKHACGKHCAVLVNVYFLSIPVVLVFDGLIFHWIGQRLFSANFANGMGDFARLLPFVSNGSLTLSGWVAAFSVGIPAFAWILSNWLVTHVKGRTKTPFLVFVAAAYGLAFLCGASHFMNATSDLTEAMEYRSSAHPFHVFGVLRTRSVGPNTTSEWRTHSGDKTATASAAPSDQQGTSSYMARERRLRMARALPSRQNTSLPDVVIVVIESLRPEVLTKDVMPNLSNLAAECIDCRYHFSGGNATNHGVFSLVTGLDPIWFGTSQRFNPGMYRWFKNLGYVTGFFAGADDWDAFHMSGFIRAPLFDEYEVRPRDGISSDRRAVELASAFLSRAERHVSMETTRSPRLAMVYLYGTHATYQSYSRDQVDQPAADNRFPFPYPARLRDAVWNRYRNSARTVDRLVKPLLARDRVIVVVGDHGEAFLEDGTAGHGIRLSRYQNMTAALLYCPGESARVIEQPTSHTDVLPTMLSFLKAQLSDPGVIDGVSLVQASEQQLVARRFCIRNYLDDDYGLIGPWTKDPAKPFAYRFTARIKTETIKPLNGIDELGLEMDLETGNEMSAELTEWTSQFYRHFTKPQTEPK